MESRSRYLETVEAAAREGRPALMGIVNVTPDSFSDGGHYLSASTARARVDALVAEGADILDLGAESSRPGATPVSAEEQLRRLAPALTAALASGRCVSVDTRSAEVARAVLAEGASVINDVSLLEDDALADAVAAHHADLVLMHTRDSFGAMAGYSQYPEDGYDDVVANVVSEWRKAQARAVGRGLGEDRIHFDPGLGFAKSARHSWTLMANTRALRHTGRTLVIGHSRKSFLVADRPCPPADRLGATLAASLWLAAEGASVLRVHDVALTRQALQVAAQLGAASEAPRRWKEGPW